MKLKKLVMAMLLVVSAFAFKNVYADDPQVLVREKVDFRIYVEDEQGKDVEGLQFSIHDKNNVFSYTSSYENDAKYYYFSKNTFEGNSNNSYSSNVPAIFSTKELNCLSNYNFNPELFQTETFSVNNGSYGTLTAYYKYIPMVLEETSTVEAKTIKIEKIIYGVVHVVPNPSSYGKYDIVFTLINNNMGGVNSEFSYVTPTDSSIRLTLTGNSFEEQVLSTRKTIVKYEADMLDVGIGAGITSSEGKEEIYLNRSSTATKPAADNGKDGSYTNGAKRTASANVEDFTLATMGDSLPVIVQERIVESPLTIYNGVLIFIVLVLAASGITYFSMKGKQKKQQTPTENQ